jgi:tRNA nucleotidyltransferase (CCA-adding enzyme)
MTPDLLSWLDEAAPGEALAGLRASGWLAGHLPEVDALYGVPQSPEHHPEVDTGIHIELCLMMAERLGASARARFAVLMHDLGKALTPKDELPKHIDHETRGLVPVAAVCERLGVPVDWRDLALLMCELHLHAHRALEMRSSSVVKFMQSAGFDQSEDAFFEDFVVACEADKLGRTGKEGQPYPQGQFLRVARRDLVALPYSIGTDMYSLPGGVRVYEERLQAVKRLKDGLGLPIA